MFIYVILDCDMFGFDNYWFVPSLVEKDASGTHLGNRKGISKEAAIFS